MKIGVTLLLVVGLVCFASAQGYTNPNLPRVTPPVVITASVNNNSLNVNNTNCWQSYCNPNTYLPFAYNHTNVVLNNNQTFRGTVNFSANNNNIGIQGVPSGGVMDKYLRFYSSGTPTFWIGDAVFNQYSGIVQEHPNKPFFFGRGDDNLAFIKQFILFSDVGTGYNSMTGMAHAFAFNQTNTFLISETELRMQRVGNTDQVISFASNNTMVLQQNVSVSGNFSANDTISGKFLANGTARTDLKYPFNGTGSFPLTTKLLIPHQTYDISATTALDTIYNNTLDRPIRLDVSFQSYIQKVPDTAYVTLQTGYQSDPSRDCSYEGNVDVGATSSSTLDLTFANHLSCTVQAGEQWELVSATDGTGSLALDFVMVTVL